MLDLDRPRSLDEYKTSHLQIGIQSQNIMTQIIQRKYWYFGLRSIVNVLLGQWIWINLSSDVSFLSSSSSFEKVLLRGPYQFSKVNWLVRHDELRSAINSRCHQMVVG